MLRRSRYSVEYLLSEAKIGWNHFRASNCPDVVARLSRSIQPWDVKIVCKGLRKGAFRHFLARLQFTWTADAHEAQPNKLSVIHRVSRRKYADLWRHTNAPHLSVQGLYKGRWDETSRSLWTNELPAKRLRNIFPFEHNASCYTCHRWLSASAWQCGESHLLIAGHGHQRSYRAHLPARPSSNQGTWDKNAFWPQSGHRRVHVNIPVSHRRPPERWWNAFQRRRWDYEPPHGLLLSHNTHRWEWYQTCIRLWWKTSWFEKRSRMCYSSSTSRSALTYCSSRNGLSDAKKQKKKVKKRKRQGLWKR